MFIYPIVFDFYFSIEFIHTSFFKRPDSDDVGIKDLAIVQHVIATAGPPMTKKFC